LIDKRTVFVLGAGASCPYGYPSGEQLRKQICLDLRGRYQKYAEKNNISGHQIGEVGDFIEKFERSNNPSIDLFITLNKNTNLVKTGKYIISHEIFCSERRSCFGEKSKIQKEKITLTNYLSHEEKFVHSGYFQGDDWYSYLFRRLTANLTKPDILPDFSNDKISFITFNYDRSLEYFLYDSMINSFTEIQEDEVVKCLKQLKIIHIYGQIALLKWQDSNNSIEYHLSINEDLLQKTAPNIKTIYEQENSPKLEEARQLLAKAERIFFLGFGDAQENMAVLGLPGIIPNRCRVYGTSFGAEEKEIRDIRNRIVSGLQPDMTMDKNEERIEIKNMDCLRLLKNCL
jgi:hypothetical protein